PVRLQTLLPARKSKASTAQSTTAAACMSLRDAEAVGTRLHRSVTQLMISARLVVQQHRTQIVIHALSKCQQENLYHEQNVTHISTSPLRTSQAYKDTSLHPARNLLTES